jgi:hypothetical protein
VSDKFAVKPIYQKHRTTELEANIEAVKNSELFFIFGDRAYVNGCKAHSDTLQLINLAKRLNKPFILCLDNTLPLADQVYLRELCPENSTQVFSFNPNKYSDIELHKRITTILNSAINGGIINDPFN